MNKTDDTLMKRAILIGLMIVFLFQTGCQVLSKPEFVVESEFITTFSIETLIESNQELLIGAKTISSESVADRQASLYQLHEQAVVEIDVDHIPDLMNAVRFDILYALTDIGAVIEGQGQGGQSEAQNYYYQYSLDGNHGVIHVWGARGEGNRFTLIVLIVES